MSAENPIPEEYVVNSERAWDQANAEKPFHDKAIELRQQAEESKDPAEKMELELQATFLEAEGAERSKMIAREQARLPADESEQVPLSDDIEATLAGLKEKHEHPVDEATIQKYEALGLPRGILEASNSKAFDQLLETRKNRLSMYRIWRARGTLEDTLEDDRAMVEDLQERRKLGQYDKDYPSDLRLKDAIANMEWNVELINEVLREERLPNEAELGARLEEISRLFADQMDMSSKLIEFSFKHYNDPKVREQVQALREEWRVVSEERNQDSLRMDWPKEFVDRVRSIHDRIYELVGEETPET